MSGQSFEFTPAGVQPLALSPVAPGSIIPAGQAIAALKQQVAEQEAARAAPAPAKTRQPLAGVALTGKSLVKQIRIRLAEVTRELRRLAALEREQAELKRLLAAAKRPPASVADINRARKSG
jgi:hypothetical protein